MKKLSLCKSISRSWLSRRRSRSQTIESLEPRCLMTLAVPAFSSLAGANQTIFLDFDGHVTTNTAWNTYDAFDNGLTNSSINSPAYDIDGNRTAFNSNELARIEEAWKRVSEDFIPFQVNVTTVDPGVEALRKSGSTDTRWGVRVVITADTENTGAGGIGYIDSFNWNSDTPVFVYTTSAKGVAEAATHEVGHSLGLQHDGTASSDYYTGHGTGDMGWAPLMGVGYYSNVTTWDRGEYFGADNVGSSANYGKGPDDLAIISTYNGFGYRADDYGNTNAAAAALTVSGTSVSRAGIIGRTTDVDVFKFTTGAGLVTLNVSPFTPGPNLDVKASLYNSSGTLVATVNPSDLLSASMSLSLAAGQYYLAVDGTGVGTPSASSPTGYTDYASLGRYFITGTIVAAESLPQLPQLTINDITVNEGAGTATFTVSVSGTLTAPVTVNYATANNSAVAGSDYTAASGLLTFSVGGATSRTVTATILNDAAIESSESFLVNLSNAVGATILDGQGLATITDNDAAAAISITAVDFIKSEGTSSSPTPFRFTVSRTGSTAGTASVGYAVSGVGLYATTASDFFTNMAPSGTMTFASGQASMTLTISIKADSAWEANERFRVTLSNPVGASLGTSTADSTIVNDDSFSTSAASRIARTQGYSLIADAFPREAFGEPIATSPTVAHSHHQGHDAKGSVSHGFVAPTFVATSTAGIGYASTQEHRTVQTLAPTVSLLLQIDRRAEWAVSDDDAPPHSANSESLPASQSQELEPESIDRLFARIQTWLEA